MTEEWLSQVPGEWTYLRGSTVLGEVLQTPCRFYWSCGGANGYCFTLTFAKSMVEAHAEEDTL